MRCPFFEEILVAFCRAYPVKKMVPSDRMQTNCICTCEGFEDCPLFQEIMAKIDGVEAGGATEVKATDAGTPSVGRKDQQEKRHGKGV